MSIIRVRTTFTGVPGAPYLSTTFWTRVDSGSAPAAASAVGAFWTAMNGNLHQDVEWNVEPFADVIDEVTGNLTGQDPIGGGESGSGTDTGELMPTQTQGLLRLATSDVVAGRVLRGRLFIPAPTEGANDQGKPVSSYLSALSSAYTALTSDPDAELLIWSRTHGTAKAVTGGQPWNQWAVLRSRRD